MLARRPQARTRQHAGRRTTWLSCCATRRLFDQLTLDLALDSAVHLRTEADARGLFADATVQSALLARVPLDKCLVAPCRSTMQLPPSVASTLHQLEASRHGDDEASLFVQIAALLLWLVHTPTNSCPHPPTQLISPASSEPSQPTCDAWRAYFQNFMPSWQDLSCLLCYSADEARLWLQVPHLVEEAALQRAWAEQQHQRWLQPLARDLGLPADPDSSFRALALARSRCLGFRLVGQGRLLVLPPVLDMANHGCATNAKVVMSGDGRELHLEPIAPILQGQEVLIDYGHERSSLDLMCDYGFVVPGNSADRMQLPGAARLPRLDMHLLKRAAVHLLDRLSETTPGLGAPEAAPHAGMAPTTDATFKRSNPTETPCHTSAPLKPTAGAQLTLTAASKGRLKAALLSFAAHTHSMPGKGIGSDGALSQLARGATPAARYQRQQAVVAWLTALQAELASYTTTSQEDAVWLQARAEGPHSGGSCGSWEEEAFGGRPAAAEHSEGVRSQSVAEGSLATRSQPCGVAGGGEGSRLKADAHVQSDARGREGPKAGAREVQAVRARLEHKLLLEQAALLLQAVRT